MQLGGTDLDEITIEEIETGKRKKIKMGKWIEHKMKNPTSSKYKTVKDETIPDLPEVYDYKENTKRKKQ